MKLKHPAVFLFGAGATRGALNAQQIPPPIDADFFDIANQLQGHGTPRLAKRVLRSVWELYGHTSGIGLEQYYRDIETRAAISRFAKTSNQPKDWQRRQRDLEELIRRVYIQTCCDPASSPLRPILSTAHKSIIASLRPKDMIVTFNYDLLIEEAFESSRYWTPIDGYGLRAQGKTHDWCRNWLATRNNNAPAQSRITLLKLHGSLNWNIQGNGSIRLKPRPYVVRTSGNLPSFEKIAILPPGWNKRIDKNPYKTFWRETRLRLEKCSSLIIVGYSLPETDLLAHALIAEAVRTRQARREYLKQLILADPNQEVKNRFTRLFAPALGPSGGVFKYAGIDELVKAMA